MAECFTQHSSWLLLMLFFHMLIFNAQRISNQRIIHWCCDSVVFLLCTPLCLCVCNCACLCVWYSCKQTRLWPIFHRKRKVQTKEIVKNNERESSETRWFHCNQTTWATCPMPAPSITFDGSWSLMVFLFFLLSRLLPYLVYLLSFLERSERVRKSEITNSI